MTNVIQLFYINTPVMWIGVALALAGAAVHFRLLPRVFAGSYDSGQTLRDTLAVPGVHSAIVWVTAAFFVASITTLTAAIVISNFSNLTVPSFARFDNVASQLQGMRISTGLGALLWGIASDF